MRSIKSRLVLSEGDYLHIDFEFVKNRPDAVQGTILRVKNNTLIVDLCGASHVKVIK